MGDVEEKTLIYLEFNDTLANETFDRDTFIRIANLHKKNPFVQINDLVYKGTFDGALGTNLFFEASDEELVENDLFNKRGPIPLKHAYSTAKVISLQLVNVPTSNPEISVKKKNIEFNLDWDYNTVLQKFSDGSLKIHDIIKESTDQEDAKEHIQVKEETTQIVDISKEDEPQIPLQDTVIEEDKECDVDNDNTDCTNLLNDYLKLRQLASRPVKSKVIQENIQQCDPKYRDSYEYHNLERQVLQPCDFFRSEPISNIDEETLSDCVDIDRCVLYGLLEDSKTHPRILTNEEKRKVLTLDNFDNLSLVARYYVLKNHVKDLEEYIKDKSEEELSNKDNYGRTPEMTLILYRKLADAVRKRIEEIKSSLTDETDVTTPSTSMEIG
ncbi:unnamed protein product [Phyllotreta striolata]|uniref:Transcription factor TFIIIC triple barrel domain-containing protein n=1 Tax=Phyllotreta striolata TaxID=444603 RepID=A0A9N9TED7_PHYSR|nr:unnamed protein product [Phyllotreta striolata]